MNDCGDQIRVCTTHLWSHFNRVPQYKYHALVLYHQFDIDCSRRKCIRDLEVKLPFWSTLIEVLYGFLNFLPPVRTYTDHSLGDILATTQCCALIGLFCGLSPHL